MFQTDLTWAVIVPMANEEADFSEFVNELEYVFDNTGSGTAYFIIDDVSKDRTLELCTSKASADKRFVTIYAPENKSVVDAYLRGYREAFKDGHEWIIEMDAGMSHDPKSIPAFLTELKSGVMCVFGSRFINGGSMTNSPLKRRFLSKFGTLLSTILLGTKLKDMTSGYQGFHRSIVEGILKYPIRSKAHFYQTELRYLLRAFTYVELPINYKAPSPRVSKRAIWNAAQTLSYYFWNRVRGRSFKIEQF